MNEVLILRLTTVDRQLSTALSRGGVDACDRIPCEARRAAVVDVVAAGVARCRVVARRRRSVPTDEPPYRRGAECRPAGEKHRTAARVPLSLRDSHQHGIPVMFFWLLCSDEKKRKGQKGQDYDATDSSFDFLRSDYRPECYAFECVVLVQKLEMTWYCPFACVWRRGARAVRLLSNPSVIL